jgi:putative NADH-flavin reductase
MTGAMKIAITGARGTVGKEVVKLCVERGHHIVQIHREHEEDNTPNSKLGKFAWLQPCHFSC